MPFMSLISQSDAKVSIVFANHSLAGRHHVTGCCVLFCCLLSAIQCMAAPGPISEDVNCANASTEPIANLNELKSKGGGIEPTIEFIEFKVLADGVDIDGWTLCLSSDPSKETCIDVGVGEGEWYDDDATSAPDGIDDSGPRSDTTFDTPTWLVYGTKNIKANEGEVILFNGSGEVMDYIRYSNRSGICTNDNKRWDVMPNAGDGHDCSVCVEDRDPSQKDFARTEPDGTGDWSNNGDATSEGASNDLPVVEEIDTYQIIHDGSASTCFREPIEITVLNNAGNPFTSYSNTVDVSTSVSHGNWFVDDGTGFSADPGQGTLTDIAGDDDGAAIYQFDGTDNGTVTLYLENTHADDLTITVAEQSGTATDTSSQLQFRNNAFVIAPTSCTGVSCPTVNTEVVAGRDHGFQIDMVRRDPTSGDCGNASGYLGSKDLKAWIARDISDPTGAGPTIGASGILPTSPPGANNLTVTFSAGTAGVQLSTTDVGKYVLNLRDDSRSFATGVDIDGSTSMLTVRPFALAFTSINDPAGPTANPGVNTPTGAIFTSAGTDFEVTVGAYLWSSADDVDNNGIADTGINVTDNGLTPSYQWDTVVTATAPFTPATGVLGTINGGFINLTDFTSGSFANTINYTEAGSMTLRADATGYLNTAGIDLSGDTTADGSNGVVGRFTPFDFNVTLDTAPVFTPACTSDTQPFTYMDQPFNYATAPAVTITARNASGNTTQNYDGTFWRLANFVETYAHVVGDPLTGGVTLDYVVAGHNAIDCSGDTCNGTFQTTFSGPFVYARSTTAIGPFDGVVDISFSVTDADGVSYAANPFIINDIEFSGSNNEQRWGRLVVGEEPGSPQIVLNVELTAEYYDGTSFVQNGDDDCTSLTLSSHVDLTSIDSGTQDGDQAMIIGAGTTSITSGNPVLANGSHWFAFSAPGIDNVGFVKIEIDLTAANMGWLMFDWDDDASFDNHPVGRATFGIISRPKELIYTREPWN